MRRIVILISTAVFLSGISFAAPPTTHQFEITSALDKVDANIGNGKCETSTLGECTLRAAVQEANAFSGKTYATISIGGTFVLTIPGALEDAAATGDLDVTGDLDIDYLTGGGYGVIDGGDLDRVFHVHSGGHLRLHRLSVGNGSTLNFDPESDVVVGEFEDGAGIWVTGEGSRLELYESILENNSAEGGGGGLSIDRGESLVPIVTNASALISGSLIRSNTAVSTGGGVSIVESAVEIRNSTIFGNSNSAQSGGGISVNNDSSDDFVTPAQQVVVINNSTIANNATSGNGGGLVNRDDIEPRVSNTAFSNNNAAGTGDDCGIASVATQAIESLGNNLISTDSVSCTGTVASDQLNVSTGLGALAAVAGTDVPHMSPTSAGSALVNKGGPLTCESEDAAGRDRPEGGGCDVGAIEFALGFAGAIVSPQPSIAIGEPVNYQIFDKDYAPFPGGFFPVVTYSLLLNGTTHDSETPSPFNSEQEPYGFSGSIPTVYSPTFTAGNGILELDGEGLVRISYTDNPNGAGGSTVRSFDIQVSGRLNELLVNGGFETNIDGTPNLPDGWTGVHPSGDKIVCNGVKIVANTGNCAFQMSNKTGTLIQSLTLPLPVSIYNDLDFVVWANTKASKPGVIATAMAKYSDGSKDKAKIKLSRATSGYQRFEADFDFDDDLVMTSLTITLSTTTLSNSKVLIDDVSLMSQFPRERGAGVLPPPIAPEGFRK